jgi:cytochrome c oxidase subunit 4
MSSEAHDIQKEVKKYMAVFGGLLVLTVATVLVRNFHIHIGVTLGIIVALIIAIIKGGLVACNFMHLTSEKRTVYMVLVLTVIFFAAMMLLIYMAHFNLPEGATYVS